MRRVADNTPFAPRIVTIGWAAITLINFTIWTLICIIRGHLEQQWWLWVGAPPGLVLGGLWLWYAEPNPASAS